MQTAFTLEQDSYVLRKFIIDDSHFPPKQKDVIFNKGDLLPIYIHRKGTREDPCYFNEELSSENNNDNKEMKDNKIDKENKENISDNKLPRALASNKNVIISLGKLASWRLPVYRITKPTV